MNDVRVVEATSSDIEALVILMAEFYAEAGYPLDVSRARAAFADLRRQPVLGRSFLITAGGAVVGHVVLTLTFSMEYGGLAAFVDDFYIRAAFRNQGIGSFALASVAAKARDLGVRAIHLEVGRDNGAAQTVYRRAGFMDNDRQLLTLQIAPAAHEETPSS